jgi:hypothetical protein
MSGFVGMDDLLNDMGDFHRRVMPDVVGPALTETGAYVLTDAKANTPVESGELRDSIRVFTNEVNRNTARLAWGSTLIYAAQVEDGGSRNVAHHMIGNANAKGVGQLATRLEVLMNHLLAGLNL